MTTLRCNCSPRNRPHTLVWNVHRVTCVLVASAHQNYIWNLFSKTPPSSWEAVIDEIVVVIRHVISQNTLSNPISEIIITFPSLALFGLSYLVNPYRMHLTTQCWFNQQNSYILLSCSNNVVSSCDWEYCCK